MTIAGFTHYYWPGRVICCGLLRPSVTELEKHINRAHRPPKPLPILSVPPGGLKEESDSELEQIEEKIGMYHQFKNIFIFKLIGVVFYLKNNKESTFPLMFSTLFFRFSIQEPTKSSDKKSLKLPAGINDDQNRYPPQHQPGDAEGNKYLIH